MNIIVAGYDFIGWTEPSLNKDRWNQDDIWKFISYDDHPEFIEIYNHH